MEKIICCMVKYERRKQIVLRDDSSSPDDGARILRDDFYTEGPFRSVVKPRILGMKSNREGLDPEQVNFKDCS